MTTNIIKALNIIISILIKTKITNKIIGDDIMNIITYVMV